MCIRDSFFTAEIREEIASLRGLSFAFIAATISFLSNSISIPSFLLIRFPYSFCLLHGSWQTFVCRFLFCQAGQTLLHLIHHLCILCLLYTSISPPHFIFHLSNIRKRAEIFQPQPLFYSYSYFASIPYFLLNRSIRPRAAAAFCCPV